MVSQRVKDKQYFEFRVLIKKKGAAKAEAPYNYIAPGVDDLLEMIWLNEGISENDIDELIIHQVNPDGSITELVKHPKDLQTENVEKLRPTTTNNTLDKLIEIMDEIRRPGSTTHAEVPNSYTTVRTPMKPKEDDVEFEVGVLGGFNYWSYPARSIE